MSDFNIRSDSVDVEKLMEQIRARIREKRGVDYSEQQLKELAAVKLERFLDARGVRSDLLEQFRKVRAETEPPVANFVFNEETLYQSHRAPIIRWIRRLLNPILRMFFNPNTIVHALNIQSQLNSRYVERDAVDRLHFEIAHNLVVEMTRIGIELKNLKMQLESLASRLEFNERRSRALEGAVAYRPSTELTGALAKPAEPPRPGAGPVESVTVQAPGAPPTPVPSASEGPGQRSRRRRRRRGRRGGSPTVAIMGHASAPAGPPSTSPVLPAGDAEGEAPSGSPSVEPQSTEGRSPDAPAPPADSVPGAGRDPQ
jgi:hypothetical protein